MEGTDVNQQMQQKGKFKLCHSLFLQNKYNGIISSSANISGAIHDDK